MTACPICLGRCIHVKKLAYGTVSVETKNEGRFAVRLIEVKRKHVRPK